MQARGQHAVAQRLRGLDEAGHAGGRVEVADVGLDRTEGAEAAPLGVGAEGLGQRGDLDRVAERGAGAVGLDIADGVGRHARDQLRRAYHLGLAVHAGRGEADLGRAVVVGRAALDDRMDGVAVAQRLVEPLEHDHARAAADHRAGGLGVEGAAVAVGREDGAGLPAVAAFLQQVEPYAARERHVAVVRQQRLAGGVHRRQRGRAGGLHAHGRAAQVELVGHARAQRTARVAAHQAQQVGDAAVRAEAERGQQVADQVDVGALARVHADLALPALGIAARMLERGPGAFEKDALLRIEGLGLARRVAEEGGIELVEALEAHAGLDVVGLREHRLRHALRAQLLVGEAPDRLHAVADVAPEGIDIVGAGKAPGHADDGDLQAGGFAGNGVEGLGRGHQWTLSAALRR